MKIDDKSGRYRLCVSHFHFFSPKFQAEIQALQEQTEILIREKIAMEDKMDATQRQIQEQTNLVHEKQEVILALSSKVR